MSQSVSASLIRNLAEVFGEGDLARSDSQARLAATASTQNLSVVTY